MASASINSLARDGTYTWVLQEANGAGPLKTQGPFPAVSILHYGKPNQPTDKEEVFQSVFGFIHEVRTPKSMWLSHLDKSGASRAFHCELIEIVESLQLQDGWGRYTAQTTIQGSYNCISKIALPVEDKHDLFALVEFQGKYDYLQTGPVANVIVKVVDESLSQELGAFLVGPSSPLFAEILTETYSIPVGHLIRLEVWTTLAHTTVQRGSFDVAGQRIMLAFSSGEKPQKTSSGLTHW